MACDPGSSTHHKTKIIYLLHYKSTQQDSLLIIIYDTTIKAPNNARPK